MACGLSHHGSGYSLVVACGFSCPVACGILVPRPGTEPISPAGGFLTPGPSGKALGGFFKSQK